MRCRGRWSRQIPKSSCSCSHADRAEWIAAVASLRRKAAPRRVRWPAGRDRPRASRSAHFPRWWTAAAAQLGPASSLRSIWDVAAVPLAEQLGFAVTPDSHSLRNARCAGLTAAGVRVELLATTLDESLDTLWRDAVRHGDCLRCSVDSLHERASTSTGRQQADVLASVCAVRPGAGAAHTRELSMFCGPSCARRHSQLAARASSHRRSGTVISAARRSGQPLAEAWGNRSGSASADRAAPMRAPRSVCSCSTNRSRSCIACFS